MYLKYIKMFMNQSVRDKVYRSHFDYHVFFIGYCLSQKLKSIKFNTDGTFDSINIEVGHSKISVNVDDHTLIINMPFDFASYDDTVYSQRCRYYLDLSKAALQTAFEYKDIPFDELIASLNSLYENNCIYSWNFNNIFIRQYNLYIEVV